jgi:hypothetical protein
VFGTFSPTRKPEGTDVLVASLPRLPQISAWFDELRVLAVSANAAEDEITKMVQRIIFKALRRDTTVLLNHPAIPNSDELCTGSSTSLLARFNHFRLFPIPKIEARPVLTNADRRREAFDVFRADFVDTVSVRHGVSDDL